jgi:hypothetical protein
LIPAIPIALVLGVCQRRNRYEETLSSGTENGIHRQFNNILTFIIGFLEMIMGDMSKKVSAVIVKCNFFLATRLHFYIINCCFFLEMSIESVQG